MMFHENRLLADDFMKHHALFFRKSGKISQNLLSAAVVIGALRVNAPVNYYGPIGVSTLFS